jgi:hypothetical protein
MDACQACGAELAENAKFCGTCGEATMIAERLAAINAWPDFTREQLLAYRSLDPDHAVKAAHHRRGYIWAYDERRGRERCFHARAGSHDSLEKGLPEDKEDLRELLAHEIDPADAPASGWRHFRFCECFICKAHRSTIVWNTDKAEQRKPASKIEAGDVAVSALDIFLGW